jgi:hypothetical protein
VRRAVFIISSLLVACSKPESSAQFQVNWGAAKSVDQKRALLNSIADNCRLPRDFFHLKDDRFYIQPRPDENYENVDCALGAVKRLHPSPNYSFIGNEYVVENKQ